VTTSGDFDVQVETLPTGTSVIRVAGEVDLATAPRLEEAISTVQPASHLVIDLLDCTFLDSSGVRLLASAGRAASEGGRVRLVAVDPGVLRVLEISGIDTILEIHPSLETAL
jgi:anti-anti-sigma factor